jgi:ATP-dependent Clp protease ATP-binding subunit ClpA
MTEQASQNKYDPIIARENEIEEAITILCRRNKSNPIFLRV